MSAEVLFLLFPWVYTASPDRLAMQGEYGIGQLSYASWLWHDVHFQSCSVGVVEGSVNRTLPCLCNLILVLLPRRSATFPVHEPSLSPGLEQLSTT